MKKIVNDNGRHKIAFKTKSLSTIVLFISLMFAISCSSYSKLKKLKGQEISVIVKELGKPETIIPSDSDSLYIYQKKTELRSTEISQGKLTLDPMISPGTTKTERYTFTVSNGIIKDVKKEIIYNR